ncbi:MAG TPA: hypothetical protein VF194_06055 [Ferrovibrio sp.]|uniref:hypothetical protein n=1 Tax=Ferrovibrio sp. TaxID=1917215 RepID=UPI002ED1695C
MARGRGANRGRPDSGRQRQGRQPENRRKHKISNFGGDTEILLPDQRWGRFSRWMPGGRISLAVTDDFSSPNSTMRRIAAQLAGQLNARLVGDEGEFYD